MRVLYVASTYGHLRVFHDPHMEALEAMGVEVEEASGGSDAFSSSNGPHRRWDVPFQRSPWSLGNARALLTLLKVLRQGDYDLIHCHTPTASALVRLARPFASRRSSVIYMAHGFHFFPGAPIRNWAIWFPIEFILARLTDWVVTINEWDQRAAERLLLARRVRYIPGVGVNLERFRPPSSRERLEVRGELDISKDRIVLCYVAEFIPRKGHRWLLQALMPFLEEPKPCTLLLVGNGPLRERIECFVTESGLTESVRFLGFREDVQRVLQGSDIVVSASRHEGLGMGIAEGQAVGLPALVSEDRGHRDLVEHGETGFIFPQGDESAFRHHLAVLLHDGAMRSRMGHRARERMSDFSIEASVGALSRVHEEALGFRKSKTSPRHAGSS